MKFLALDVETANADYSSICQIGIAEFEDGEVIHKWSSLVNPEAYFDPFNISIHGIDEKKVKDAPTFDKIYTELKLRLQEKITVHHMPFDRIAISRACREYDLENINAFWLDSAKIARRTWEQFAYRGYGLAKIAEHLRIEFLHHDALEDAIVAGKIVTEACILKNITVDQWLERVSKPIKPKDNTNAIVKLNANPEGPLFGETLVFTGALSLPRKEASIIAAELGCEIGDSVSKNTTILVVGTQDASKLGGYEKSTKHRKAEELNNKGFIIKILSENDFIEICNSACSDLNFFPPTLVSNSEIPISGKLNDKAEETILLTGSVNDAVSEDIKEFWIDDIFEVDEEARKIIDSLAKCNQEEKRKLAGEFKAGLEIVSDSYLQLDIESHGDDDIDIIFTLDTEIGRLHEAIYDLMKNKISLGEYFNYLDESIYFISSDLEGSIIPHNIKEYAEVTLAELKKMAEKIKAFSPHNDH